MYFREIKIILENEDAKLYMTDDLETAKNLQERGEAVLIYLHEGNRDVDFSGFMYALEKPEEADEEYYNRVYRRLRGLPWNITETWRCLIRETTVEDVDDFYGIYSEPSITKYMDNLYQDPEQERQYARDYIEKVYGFYEFGVWTVVEKESGRVIGRAGISCRDGFEEPELGFVIGVPWQRRGYAEEVCGEILRYAAQDLGFEAVQALVEPENAASIALCRKLGMTPAEKISLDGKKYIRMLIRWEGTQ